MDKWNSKIRSSKNSTGKLIRTMYRLKKEPTKFSNKSCRNFYKVRSQPKNDLMALPDNLKIQLLWRRTYCKIMNSVKRVVQSVLKLLYSFTHGDATKTVN